MIDDRIYLAMQKVDHKINISRTINDTNLKLSLAITTITIYVKVHHQLLSTISRNLKFCKTPYTSINVVIEFTRYHSITIANSTVGVVNLSWFYIGDSLVRNPFKSQAFTFTLRIGSNCQSLDY